MFALVAAVLFGLAVILALLGLLGVASVSATLYNLLLFGGLLCVALELAGVRSRRYSRR